MNIVQLNQYIEKIARCIQIVHSYSSQSPYEYWNAKGDVQYGSVCFCIKKSRMRSNTITYDAVLYYGDRVVDTPSNKEQIWSDANNVIQNIVGTINMQGDGEVTVSYPYDITNFEQKFADNLAGAYATLSIDTRGTGECGDLLYGYEGSQEDIKLESIVKTITVNGEYDITSSKDYDAISDVKVIVNVAPDPKDTFATIGYNDETAGGFLNQFSEDLELSKRILDEWNSTGSSAIDIGKWMDDTVYFPAVDLTMKPTGMAIRFYNWKKLQVVPSLNFTGRTSAQHLFQGCSLLRYVGNITGTESVTSMYYTFSGCSSLTSIPQMDTSNVTNMESMFTSCTSLTSIPQMNTSKVTTMYYMFNNCASLTSIPQMDTRNVQNMNSMFGNCKSLTSIPQIDTSKVTTMYSMFEYCISLTSIPQMNTSKVNNMGYMFSDCVSLTSIPLLDCSSVTSTYGPLGFFTLNKLTDLGGFKDLKVSWSSYFLDNAPNATVESLMNVINNLYDLTANGLSGKTLKFGTTNLNKLTADQIAVATNKGWTLT